MSTEVQNHDDSIHETSDISDSNNNLADMNNDSTHSDDREGEDNANTNVFDCNDGADMNDSTDTDSDTNDNEREIIINTLLTYACYSISSATADNTRTLMSSHFTIDEICDAKDLLWSRCNLGETINRKNTKVRTASVAHIGDILDALYSLDMMKKMPLFVIDPSGITRLPHGNPESINVIAIDQRLVSLQEICNTLQMQLNSYRNDFLQQNDSITVVKNVVQQHTDVLRNMRIQHQPPPPRAFSHVPPCYTTPMHRPYSSSSYVQPEHQYTPAHGTVSGKPTTPPPAVMSPTSVSGATCATSTSVMSSSSQQGQPTTTSSPIKAHPSHPRPVPHVAVTSPRNQQVKGPPSNGDNTRDNVTSSANDDGGSVENRSSSRPKPQRYRHNRYDRTIKHDTSVGEQFCMFDGIDDINNLGASGGGGEQSTDVRDEPFNQPAYVERRNRKRENERRKVVYGTANEFSVYSRGGRDFKNKKCDLFIYHAPHSTTVGNLKKHLEKKGFNVSNFRIDVTSNSLADFRSFRLIAPIDSENDLFCPDVWPRGMRVKEFTPPRKGIKARRGYSP